MSEPTCLFADDHPALRAAVASFLLDHGYALVGPVADGRRAVEAAAETKPELALVDYRMPRLSGAELIRELLAVSPETKIVVYTADADEETAQEALAAGARGIVLKGAPFGDLGRALDAVLGGRSYLDVEINRIAQGEIHLTPRETEVLALLAQGLQHEEIGKTLGIGSETVRTHLRKATERLGATSRTQAVAMAIRHGLI
jgi:DNA-binding NarL/FixJ family response regulator